MVPDANHGAGIFTYIETPFLWPSFVGKYTSTMVRIWGWHQGGFSGDNDDYNCITLPVRTKLVLDLEWIGMEKKTHAFSTLRSGPDASWCGFKLPKWELSSRNKRVSPNTNLGCIGRISQWYRTSQQFRHNLSGRCWGKRRNIPWSQVIFSHDGSTTRVVSIHGFSSAQPLSRIMYRYIVLYR